MNYRFVGWAKKKKRAPQRRTKRKTKRGAARKAWPWGRFGYGGNIGAHHHGKTGFATRAAAVSAVKRLVKASPPLSEMDFLTAYPLLQDGGMNFKGRKNRWVVVKGKWHSERQTK